MQLVAFDADIEQITVFSSTEQKAQVSFSDYVFVRLSVCKRLTFLTSTEPLGEFQPNLAESIIG